jgi:hypothetical protein
MRPAYQKLGALLLAAAGSIPACDRPSNRIKTHCSVPAGTTFAVAPVLNFSGEFDLDPVQAADLLASELTHFEGAVVLPVNRVVAALAAEGKRQVESPTHAVALAEAVGADAILIAGITEYDAYTPVVGLILQMYIVSNGTAPVLDARIASREAAPATLTEMADFSTPVGQIQKVYNATHDDVVDAVEEYACPRSEGDSPYGWREYLKVQTKFLRFCWCDSLARLMKQQLRRGPVVARAGAREDVAWTP